MVAVLPLSGDYERRVQVLHQSIFLVFMPARGEWVDVNRIVTTPTIKNRLKLQTLAVACALPGVNRLLGALHIETNTE